LADWPNSFLPNLEDIEELRNVKSMTVDELRGFCDFDYEERTLASQDGLADVVLSIFRPQGTTSPTPAMYFIHGGGLVSGDRFSDLEHLISVEYRLAPEYRYPVPVDDCFAGLLWVSDHAEFLGIDASRIFLYGVSAGAGLAASVALMARDLSGPAIAAQVLSIPMLDHRNGTPSSRQFDGFGGWDRASIQSGWTAMLGNGHGELEISPYASPARATDLSSLPPTYLDVGSAEVFRDEAIDYAREIWAVGGQAELHVWSGGFHGFEYVVPGAPLSTTSAQTTLKWMERTLGLVAR
jgi:acetyl esterase/lipase